jgi:hypothetical protein
MPLVATDVGVTTSNPRFSYVAQTTDLLSGNIGTITTPARFNAFNNSISTGAFDLLPPGASASEPPRRPDSVPWLPRTRYGLPGRTYPYPVGTAHLTARQVIDLGL